MNNKYPLVSVVIPTHNRVNFFIKTIKSITDQTYTNIEIFVVSNGINNANKQAVASIIDSRISYIDQENSGCPASPRNHGIRLSKGKYIAFCDDDDLWLPDKLEKQVKALEANKDCDFCYTKMIRYDDDGNEWTEENDSGPEVTLRSLLFVNTVPISSVIIRADLLKKVGGFCEAKRVGTSEDYEFILRCATYTRFFLLDEYLVKYYSGNKRTTSVNDRNILKAVSKTASYTCGVLGCYYSLLKLHLVKISDLYKPAAYQLNLCFKRILYIVVLQWIRKIRGKA